MIGNISQNTGSNPFTIQRAMQKDSKESLEKDASNDLVAQKNVSMQAFAPKKTQMNQLTSLVQSDISSLQAERELRSVNRGGIVAQTSVDSSYVLSTIANKRGMETLSNISKENLMSASQENLDQFQEYIDEKVTEATTPTKDDTSLELQVPESSEEVTTLEENPDSVVVSDSEVAAAPAPEVEQAPVSAPVAASPAVPTPAKTSVDITV